MNRLAIFDCDGTLVDSQANICLAMEAAFASAGLPAPARQATRRIVGLSLVEAMQALLPDAEDALHLALAADYKAAFWRLRAEGLVEEPLFDGIADLLDRLRDDGWLLAVATGKSDRGLAHVLDHHGLTGHFISLQTADRHPSKPHPSMIAQAMADAGATPETSAMIGDTSYDVLMALAAGTQALGVSWGYHAPAELTALGAHAVADHPAQLADLLDQR
ncbi:phosphoglycolate phosphatase [Sphingomonas zeicaulis]|uniref:HAD-IA family hydrolase n=1 Tax=Sphingomonas zeicaulis TaxID=1632740 RepID=UPI003D1F3862